MMLEHKGITNDIKDDKEALEENEFCEAKLKKYTQPKLRKLGVIQKVTLGGSIGTGDSAGNSFSQQP